MPTTNGAVAFDGAVPRFEATVVENLRAAGAIILAKTTMTEFGNSVTYQGPVGSFSALGGHVPNPYNPRPDPRPGFDDGRPSMSPGGSSTGSAPRPTCGPPTSEPRPSARRSNRSRTMLVGIKPTVGRLSRHGVTPLLLEQVTPTQMAKSVVDAAILLGVMEGAAPIRPIRRPPVASRRRDGTTPPISRRAACGEANRYPAQVLLRAGEIGGTSQQSTVSPDTERVTALMAEAIAILENEGRSWSTRRTFRAWWIRIPRRTS